MVLEESGGGSGGWNKEEVERVSAWAADRQGWAVTIRKQEVVGSPSL